MSFETREQWLTEAGRRIFTDIIGPVVAASDITADRGWMVSCGWPSVRATARSNKRIGECWSPNACADKATYHIFISPALHEPVGEQRTGVLPTLVHELVHAVTGNQGHRRPFPQVATAVGLDGKMTATRAGFLLGPQLVELAAELGPYPHAAIDYTTGRKVQSTRLIKVEALTCCGYVARVSRTWLETGELRCPHGKVLWEVGAL